MLMYNLPIVNDASTFIFTASNPFNINNKRTSYNYRIFLDLPKFWLLVPTNE